MTKPAAARAIRRSNSEAAEEMGGQLSSAFRASWLPKVTNGWFFRAVKDTDHFKVMREFCEDPKGFV